MWDLLIQNGTVVNPEGQMKADIALQGEKVVAVGKLQNMQARQIIDAQGKWVLPGMIDSHAHIQTGVGERRSGDTYYTGSIAAACGASIPLTLGAIISAACFGAQACFYSDVTLLSASACKISNVDYAVAQLPYIGIVAGVSFVGYVAAGFLMI